jgi:uncharacterized protein YdeI (BOF family)
VKRSFTGIVSGVLIIVIALSAAFAEDGTQTEAQPIGSIRRGETVTVSGEIIRVRGYDEFVIEDETGRVSVYVEGGFSRSEIQTGQRVTVRGRVDDDLLVFRREIYATEVVLSD